MSTVLESETTSTSTSELLDGLAAAEVLGLSDHTLAVWRMTGRYRLPFIRVGRRIKYRRADLMAWLETRRVAN